MARSPRPTRRARLLAWAAPCLVLGAGTAAMGGHEGGGERPAAAARPGGGQTFLEDTLQLVVVSPRPWTAAVAITLSFAGGYGDDPAGDEGTAWLLGMVLERAARANLAETGAVADMEVEDARTRVTLLATSSDWKAAYGILIRTLLTDPLDAALVAQARADLSDQVLFQRAAPVRAFELEARRMLLGAERARSPMGTPSSVTGITVADLEAKRARLYRRGLARMAVVGAVEPAEAASVVGAHRTMAWRGAETWAVEGAPLPPRAPGRVWEAGGRYSAADEITNNWILAAYPFAGTTPRRSMRFLAHLIGDQLLVDPPAPGLISRRVEVRELPGGPVLQVTIAAQWPTVRAWEQRIVDVVDRLAATPLAADDVILQHRRFRSARALALADPVREGRELLTGAEVDGGPGELHAPMEGLSAEEVRRAAADLGAPRVLVFGPGEPPP